MEWQIPVFDWEIGWENGVAAAVREFKRRFPNLNQSTVRSFRKKSRGRAEEGFIGKKRTIQSNRKIFVTNRTPFDARTTRFSGPNLYLFFFINNSFFYRRPENFLSFSKKSPPKLFSNCLVDGILTSIF